MKTIIVSLLKERYPEFVSGEELSKIINTSRTAVWKHIRNLRENGYEIESYPKLGYRLLHTPDKLFDHELAQVLKTQVLGRTIVYREKIGSTNELAKEIARTGSPKGTLVVAEEQTEGKGRMGRFWHSPGGRGLWFSLILRPAISPADASKITLVTAVGVAKAIRELTGIKAGIKWPNDILIDGRKTAGILTEINAELDRINYLIVGIGINVSLRAEGVPELAQIATSLEEHSGSPVSRIRLLSMILENLDSLYQRFETGDFLTILEDWKKMSVTLNHMVKVTSLRDTDEGIAVDIDVDGALLIRKNDGTIKRVYSGEVTLR